MTTWWQDRGFPSPLPTHNDLTFRHLLFSVIASSPNMNGNQKLNALHRVIFYPCCLVMWITYVSISSSVLDKEKRGHWKTGGLKTTETASIKLITSFES